MPITLPLNSQQQQQTNVHHHNPLDLAKPILLDCDYDFKPNEDARLTVRWFKNKEAEPFYQWLPELNVRHFADWIKPLVNQTFVSDPHDPMKRYRSLLLRRLSMNLTAQYSCLVSSLASQDMRQASLVVYQPPKLFTFEHHIYPLPSMVTETAVSLNSNHDNNNVFNGAASSTLPSVSSRQTQNGFARVAGSGQFQSPYFQFNNLSQVRKVEPPTRQQQQQQLESESESESIGWKSRPTQFKGYSNSKAIVRPPNNNSSMLTAATTTSTTIVPPTVLSNTEGGEKIVYTHDGRPVKRKQQTKRQLNLPNSINWMLASNERDSSPGPLFEPSSVRESQLLGIFPEASSHSSSSSLSNLKKQRREPKLPLSPSPPPTRWSIQLHHFQCQAMQVTPRPVIVLTVKRDTDSIAQYLHESSSVSIRPYQVSQSEYYLEMLAKGGNSHVDRPYTNHSVRGSSRVVISNERHHYLAPPPPQLDKEKEKEEEELLVTLYDITVSATVALNVSLPATYSSSSSGKLQRGQLLETTSGSSGATSSPMDDLLSSDWPSSREPVDLQHGQQMGINTVLSFKHNQRMSFECHLEITGTEFEQRKRINIKEEGELLSLSPFTFYLLPFALYFGLSIATFSSWLVSLASCKLQQQQ